MENKIAGLCEYCQTGLYTSDRRCPSCGASVPLFADASRITTVIPSVYTDYTMACSTSAALCFDDHLRGR